MFLCYIEQPYKRECPLVDKLYNFITQNMAEGCFSHFFIDFFNFRSLAVINADIDRLANN